MTEIVVIWGAGPEAIKVGPLAAELEVLGAAWRGLCTGQHYSLLRGTPAETDLKGSDSLLLASDGNIARWLTLAHDKLRDYFTETRPQLVVVQGDTMSAFAGTMAAYLARIPVAHVEAGVPSHAPNNPWPEEGIRTEIDKLAVWHYAPTQTAFANLVQEERENVLLTGNTAVSALARYAGDVRVRPNPDATIVVTLHRREIQTAERMGWLYGAIRLQALRYPEYRFVWPVHPAVEKLIKPWQEPFNLVRCAPLGYHAMIALVADSIGVLTDSGGLVEECATLGVPCVILRAVNDRPEAVEAGIAQQFAPTAEGVRQGVEWLQKAPRVPTNIYGHEDAAWRIAE